MRREYTSPSPVLQSFTAVQLTLNWNVPAPWTKNGRRSWKNVSNAVRLSTPGSASTWPKSGLIVASSLRLEATRYFKSPPTVTSCERPRPVDENSETFLVTRYGAASSRRGAWSPSSPWISPNCDTKPACDCRKSGQLTRCEYRYRSRSIVKPNVWTRCPPHGNCESGIRNSAVQPAESIWVATSHTASHAKSSLPSL